MLHEKPQASIWLEVDLSVCPESSYYDYYYYYYHYYCTITFSIEIYRGEFLKVNGK